MPFDLRLASRSPRTSSHLSRAADRVATTRPTRRRAAALLASALLVAACGNTAATDPAGAPAVTGDEAPTPDLDAQLGVSVASFDLAVGEDQRLLAGLLTGDLGVVAGGEVTFQLGHLGDAAGGMAELTEQATASFLPVPGMEPADLGADPTELTDRTGSGVYAATVDLDQPGFWGLRVVAELDDGRVLEGQATFDVLPEPLVPAVGDDAPRTVNLTMADVEAGRAEPAALDSRAQGADPTVPDQHLHRTTVADAIEAGRPVVVIVATPVYCVSRFCGPLTETLADTARTHADRADFVHLEVWEEFETGTLNEAAAAWIQTETGGNEPWVFLVDADGTVAARWDNVLDLAELEALLEELPTIEPLADA